MNKTAIRNFAIWARNKLIVDVSYRAGLMGVTKVGISDALPQSTSDVEFYDIGTAEPYSIHNGEIKQRKSLVELIRQKEKGSDYITAYTSVIEEVAYTWFNRLIAVRFMEVNDYMPAHIRALSSETGKLEPDIVTTPFDAELELTDVEKQQIIQLKNDNKLDDCFRMLFIKQCNALHEFLPRLFENTKDYTELLLNVSFVDQEGVVYRLVHDIEEDDFNIEKGGQVEIIGWLYQYYNSELKDETFALLKNNVKVTKERIPSATQLFTPDWIVRYMVENSLGRLWVEGHPNDSLKSEWKYYLDEAEQEADVQAQLDEIRKEYAKLTPSDIKIIDPCMGSGHILVYAFDVLMQIYESAGYTQRDAAKSILENNLFGLDIDERAAQLAYFAVLMKARQYNRRILSDYTMCNVYAIRESNGIDKDALNILGDTRIVAEKLLDTYIDAKEYGSLLNLDVTEEELTLLGEKIEELRCKESFVDVFEAANTEIIFSRIMPLLLQAKVMVQKYDSVITNPPYMGNGSMGNKLLTYAKKHYTDCKMDLFAMFIDRCGRLVNQNRIYAMITQPSFLYLSSFEKLRKQLIEKKNVISLLDMGRGIFGIDFGSTSFVIRNSKNAKYRGGYSKLYKRIFQYIAPDDIRDLYLKTKGNEESTFDFDLYENSGNGIIINTELGQRVFYYSDQTNFTKIPNTPFAYWVSDKLAQGFETYPSVGSVAEIKHGMSTGNNDAILRSWMEVNNLDINYMSESEEQFNNSNARYAPYNKGGDYRKWYGNQWYVIGYDLKYNDLMDSFSGHRHDNKSFYFKEGFTWSTVSAGDISLRYSPKGYIFDSKGSMGFTESTERTLYLMALINSKVCKECLRVLSPTIDYNAGSLRQLPLIEEQQGKIAEIVHETVSMSKEEWNSYETSWEFKKHPLI